MCIDSKDSSRSINDNCVQKSKVYAALIGALFVNLGVKGVCSFDWRFIHEFMSQRRMQL